MPEPTVACILLTKDRPQMARRAVASFRAQTYANKRLIIFDTGINNEWFNDRADDEMHVWHTHPRAGIQCNETIGALRNKANRVLTGPDIFAHFDDDDLSHANRITEQVALLQASGADAVGYREMLFWRTTINHPGGLPVALDIKGDGFAWLYSNPDPRYCIGSSLMYWRSAWERNPFNENLSPTGRGEDHEFWRGLKSVGVSSFGACGCHEPSKEHEPRMICSIHAGNAQHYPSDVLESSQSWKRVPVWDNWCRKVMAL